GAAWVREQHHDAVTRQQLIPLVPAAVEPYPPRPFRPPVDMDHRGIPLAGAKVGRCDQDAVHRASVAGVPRDLLDLPECECPQAGHSPPPVTVPCAVTASVLGAPPWRSTAGSPVERRPVYRTEKATASPAGAKRIGPVPSASRVVSLVFRSRV